MTNISPVACCILFSFFFFDSILKFKVQVSSGAQQFKMNF